MKIYLTILLTCIVTIFSNANASEEKAETKPSRTGGHFAVTEFNKEDGFKLSEQALKTLDIKFQALKGEKIWTVPSTAIVHLKHTSGVYRRYDGWISYVLVSVTKRNENDVQITSSDLESGDEIATTGTHFLRMTEVDLNTDTVDGCAH